MTAATTVRTATVVTKLTEDQVLDYFWSMQRNPEVDRAQLLKQLSTVIIKRPSDWDREAIRRDWKVLTETNRQLMADDCFACRTRDLRLYWHHVIWVAHNGSNTRRNYVALCYFCHQKLHPQLTDRTREQERRGGRWQRPTEFLS